MRFDWKRKAVTFAALVAVATMAGPFGTYLELSAGSRFVYWLLAIAGCGFFMNIGIYFALTHPDVSKVSRLLRLTVAVLIAAIPGALVVMMLEFLFRGVTLTPGFAFKAWAFISAIGLAVGHAEARHTVAGPAEEGPVSPSQPVPEIRPPDPEPPVFFRQLKAGMGRNLVSLTMHDHYLEVVTDAGRDMILKRMSDAVAELAGYRGMRIHRSHWVALDAVTGLERSSGRTLAILLDGRRLPVSRNHASELKRLLESRSGTPASRETGPPASGETGVQVR